MKIMNYSLRNYYFSLDVARNLRVREPAVDVKTKVSCRMIIYVFTVLSYSAVVVKCIVDIYYVNFEAYNSTDGAMMLETTYRRKVPCHWLADTSSE